MNNVRTRFAPSPTGFMHIGNLRTALYAYLFAKSQGGDFILRIEDTDHERSVEGAIDVIYSTLQMSALRHDEGPDVGGSCAPYVQSMRKDIYKKYAIELVQKGYAYYCFCPKETLEASKTEEGYNRHCRNLSDSEVQQNLQAGMPYVIRQKMPMEGKTEFNDLVFGTIEVENRLLDDQILLKSDGLPTYNFANVVDDHLMYISHVVRGSEYLSSTPKYVLLYRAFGWEIPHFIHLPLIMGKNADGSVTKLSKRHGATGFHDLVEGGYLPSAIVNYIALLGWSPKSEREIFSLAELTEIFSVAGINKSPSVFDYQKLNWINGEHIKMLPFEEFCNMAMPFSKICGTRLEKQWQAIAQLLHSRTSNFSQIPQTIAFLLEMPTYETELFENPRNKSTVVSSIIVLEATLNAIKTLDQWDFSTLHNAFTELAQQQNQKFGQMMWPVRIALSGLAVTPGGAVDIMTILGKETSLQRIENAINRLKNSTN